MREIKFRAWTSEIKEMQYDPKMGSIKAMEIISLNDSIATYENLMQFTGLHDKNGKEIYEGDIVKWGHAREYSKENPIRIAEVKFNPDIQFHSQVGIFKFGNFAYAETADKDLEIIGNIYENPDLLTSHKA